jgi:hypothetical protein
VIFAFVTGEEKGLQGSKFFATHPTVDRNSIVADINIDMFLPISPVEKAHRLRPHRIRPGRRRNQNRPSPAASPSSPIKNPCATSSSAAISTASSAKASHPSP